MRSKADALSLGNEGEDLAAHYLESKGLKVEARHYHTRWGEIDLICRDRDTWVFVEVKTRTRASNPTAVESITRAKQKKIAGAAISYMKKHRIIGQDARFDVVLIEGSAVEWLPNAFESPITYTC